LLLPGADGSRLIAGSTKRELASRPHVADPGLW